MRAKVYRDRYGVPHIEGDTLEGAYFGLGFAGAQDRPRTLPLHQRLVQGRLCEALGVVRLPNIDLPILDGLAATPFFRGYADHAWDVTDTRAVDKWMFLWDYFGNAAAGLADLSDRSRSIVEAYCSGVNHYFDRHEPPEWFETYEPATEVAWWGYYEHTIAMAFAISNAFAVAPSQSEDRSVWVGGDPHYWFLDGHAEAHLRTAGFDLAGVWDGHVNLAMWGGTNLHVAMGITASGIEQAVTYEEKVDPENRERYWDSRSDSWCPFEVRRWDVGGETFLARRTHHGQVVGEGSVQGQPVAYTVQSPFHEAPGVSLDQHLELWRQTTVRGFIKHVGASPFLRGHRLVGDRGGNIGYVSNGPVAVRDGSFDWTKPVDGSTDATTLQTQLWRPGAKEYGLPIIVNPECGFIQSANDAPWLATVPARARFDYPDYVYPPGWRQLGTRGATQRRFLAANRSLGRAELEAHLYNCFVPAAYYGLRGLRSVYADEPGAPNLSPAAALLDETLAAWDGRATLESTAMTVAFYLNRTLDGGIPVPAIVASDDPVGTPEIRAPDVSRDQARGYAYGLERVAVELQRLYGTLNKPWGEIHVVERPGGEVPIPGGCNELRALLGTWGGWWDDGDDITSDGVQRCKFGSRTLHLTRLGAESVETFSIAITGQVPANEHPGSPHHRDQTELYAACRLKKLPLRQAGYTADARQTDHEHCNHDAVVELVWSPQIRRDTSA
jgi:acyl-homoserine-lactone acylase